MRLSSFIRTDSEGKRIRGDKFVITQHGKCCCQPPRQKEYNVVSFIKEHPHLFAEYHEGINPDRLVELVCYRLLHYPIPEQETRTGQPQRDTRPFDIADYNIQKFDPQDRGTQEKFAPYFEKGVSTSVRSKPFTGTSVWRPDTARTVRGALASPFR